MADFWIKLEKNTPDKPEIFEIAEILGIDPDAVLGKLIRVWCWIDSNSADGHIKSVTHVLIDRLTMSQGFADAMTSVGWLEESSIPNFSRHLGESAKKRAKDSERKRMSRTSSEECHKKSVTKSGLDKSRVDKSRVEHKQKDNDTLAIFTEYGFTQDQIKLIHDNRKKNSKSAKSAKITEIIANSICKEMTKCRWLGYTVDDVLNEWHESTWVTFKCEWIKNRIPLNKNGGDNYGKNRPISSPKETPEQRLSRLSREMAAKRRAHSDNGTILDTDGAIISTQVDNYSGGSH